MLLIYKLAQFSSTAQRIKEIKVLFEYETWFGDYLPAPMNKGRRTNTLRFEDRNGVQNDWDIHLLMIEFIL